MKKGKLLFAFTALTTLALTSCGEQSYQGMYQFQMGKANESHIGIYMDLSKDKIKIGEEGEQVEMEKFKLSLSVPESATGDDQSLIGGLLTFFDDGLSGGYKIEPVEGEDYDHLVLTPVIDISDLLKVVEDSSEDESSSSSQPDTSSSDDDDKFIIPSEYLDDIMIAKYYKDSISVTIPVSLNDLMFQLYWYGFDLFDLEGKYPPVKHDHGTHPTEEDIAKINETFNSDDRFIKHIDLDAYMKYKSALVPAPIVAFRDFSQLTMTLTRAQKL